MNNKTSQTNQENYQLLTIDIETESTTEEKEHALIPHLNRITVIGVENVETGHTAVYRNLEEFKRDIWQDPEFKFLGHNFKWDFKNLTYHLGQLPAAGYSAYLHDTRAMAAICTDKVPESYLETYEAKRKKLNLLLPKGQGHREARGNSLKVLAPYFLGVDPFWETTTNHNNDTYVLQDVQYTTRLYKFLTQRLQELGQYDFYLKNMEWNRSAITPAEVNGLQLDAPNLIKLKEQLSFEERQLQTQIRGEWLPHMLAWEQKARDELQQEYQQMFEQAYSKPTKKPKDVAALQSKYAGLYHNSITKNPPKFNLDSPLQMKWLLKEQLNYNVTNLEGKESTGVEVLERLARTDETVSKLLKFRETQKVLTGFIPEYLAMQRPNGSINTNFNFDGTRTGRLSCIAKGTLIQVPGGEVPIEEVKEGDYVYCYTKNNKLTIKKVTATHKQGVKETVKIKVQSSGDGRVLELICTPDHKIKTKYKGWVEAKDLTQHTKVLHLRRNKLPSGRIRLYSTDRGQELEEAIIKREFFKAPPQLHIHHIDTNKSNNSLDNLAICTRRGHIKIHSQLNGEITGQRQTVTKEYSKYSILRMIAKVRGKTSLAKLGFVALKRHANMRGISIPEVTSRYSKVTGLYLNQTNVLKALEGRDVEQAAKVLGIGTRKLKALCWKYGITYNHMIVSVKPHLPMETFDLTVEDEHNFIAGEICVHNCSSINLQQTPKRLKSYFTARPGKLLATYDLGAIEPVILAYFSQDPNLCKLILAGESFHSINAINMFNLECTEKEVKKLYPLERDLAKTLGLAILYGAGVNRVVMAAAQAGVEISHSRAKEIVYGLRNYYKGVWEFKQELDQLLESGEVLFNLFGRPFKIENRDDVYMKGLNTLIQGSGSDLTQQAACDISKIPGCTPLAFVHDSVVTEIDAVRSEELCNKIQYEFTKFKLPSQYGNLPLTVEGGAYECWD